jgi:DNA-binding MarR family transcriptional regulator
MPEETKQVIIDSLHRIGRQMRRTHDLSSGAGSLTLHQLQALQTIRHKQPVKMRDLANELGVSPASATLLVDKLIEGGWLSRTTDEQDRRSIYVQLTDIAKQRFTELRKRRHEQIDRILGHLARKDLEDLARILDKVCETMEAAS